jgi:hypothetical protein
MGIYLLTIRKFSGPTTASEPQDQETFNTARYDEMDKRGRGWRGRFFEHVLYENRKSCYSVKAGGKETAVLRHNPNRCERTRRKFALDLP